MRKVILSLVIVSCAAAVTAAGAQTGITPLPKEKLEAPVVSFPEAVVKELYRVHRNGSGHVFEKQGRKQQQQFFDRKLAALIWKNLSETPEGEVGNIDFDPLYNAQDTQVKSFRVGAAALKGDTATVPVTFTNFDRKVRIEFRLVNTREGWRVSNIVYGGGSDLVQILSQPM
jgi:cation diffusion facilitator CzcD-associated flavoprotein CzcO